MPGPGKGQPSLYTFLDATKITAFFHLRARGFGPKPAAKLAKSITPEQVIRPHNADPELRLPQIIETLTNWTNQK